MRIILFLALVLGGASFAYADSDCSDTVFGGTIQYKEIPAGYFINGTAGFVALCGNQEHYWFDVFLDGADSAGSITLEMPKKSLDLRQFDYESCEHANNLFYAIDDDGQFDQTIIVRGQQILETDDTRTIQIMWDRPVDSGHIIYFAGGSFLPRNDTGYDIGVSMPKQCIMDAEDRLSGKIVYPSDEDYERAYKTLDHFCSHPETIIIYLNHTVTNGELKRICAVSYSLILEIDSFDDGEIIIDLPRDVFSPCGNPYGNSWDRDCHFQADVYPSLIETNSHGVGREYWPEHYPEDLLIGFGVLMENKDYLITKLEQNESCKRYKIPFVDGEVVFMLSYASNLKIPSWSYNYDKYSNPTQASHTVCVPGHADKDEKPCRGDLMLISRHNADRVACVNPSTAERLAERGWVLR